MAQESYSVEVYRQEVDDLSFKIAALIDRELGNLPQIDRSIIVAAALGNVACWCDGKITVPVQADADGATGRLQRIATGWSG
ncbi:hypothetical protein [Bradyrhizobium sp.]